MTKQPSYATEDTTNATEPSATRRTLSLVVYGRNQVVPAHLSRWCGELRIPVRGEGVDGLARGEWLLLRHVVLHRSDVEGVVRRREELDGRQSVDAHGARVCEVGSVVI
jgi:hypothetical protein